MTLIVYGLLSAGARFPCVFCEEDRANFGNLNSVANARTLQTIDDCYNFHEDYYFFIETTKLNADSRGVERAPLTNIEINRICPAPLHIILGVGRFIVEKFEEEFDLSQIYAKLNMKKDEHTKTFTGVISFFGLYCFSNQREPANFDILISVDILI